MNSEKNSRYYLRHVTKKVTGMAVSGADQQRAYLQRQREASARPAEELLALRREAAKARAMVEVLRERSAALETELRAGQEPRDLGQFLWPTPKRPNRQ